MIHCSRCQRLTDGLDGLCSRCLPAPAADTERFLVERVRESEIHIQMAWIQRQVAENPTSDPYLGLRFLD